jgi:CheY-like chemotaxis protein
MPGMNGIELGRRLRQRFPAAQLRLIALSGYADADIRDACLASVSMRTWSSRQIYRNWSN